MCRSPIQVATDCSFRAARTMIRGFETALTGYVTPDWQSSLGYAYTDARITSATSPTIVPGNRVQLVPYNQFSLWNKYQFNPTWAAALGVIYFSDSFASSDDSVRLPGFVRFDAAVYAKIDENWSVAVQRREHLQQGLLGLRRRQQQHLAGPAAHVPHECDRQVLAIWNRAWRLVCVRQFRRRELRSQRLFSGCGA